MSRSSRCRRRSSMSTAPPTTTASLLSSSGALFTAEKLSEGIEDATRQRGSLVVSIAETLREPRLHTAVDVAGGRRDLVQRQIDLVAGSLRDAFVGREFVGIGADQRV